MINWINSWRTGNKKNKIDFTLRLGFLTLFELKFCAFCEKDLSRTAFKDWKSVDESLISALCQECQDETFEEVSDE